MDTTAGRHRDESVVAGTAAAHRRGRISYAPGTAGVVAKVLAADPAHRLLDVGCGPGTIGVALAPYFGEVVGIDPDPELIAEAELWADGAGVTARTRWLPLRPGDLPAGLGQFDAVTVAEPQHWMDDAALPATLHAMLRPGGALVHIAEWKNELRTADGLPHPAAPQAAIDDLVWQYLGTALPAPDSAPADEAAALADAGFDGPDHHIVRGGQHLVRTEDDVVAGVYTHTHAAPHLFGGQLDSFETELRRLLQQESPSGLFSERQSSAELRIWYTEED